MSSSTTGDVVEWLWHMASKPAGSTAVITDPSSVSTAVSCDLPGNYILFLVVRDSDGAISDGGVDVDGVLTVDDASIIGTSPDAFAIAKVLTQNASLELPDNMQTEDDWCDAYRSLVAFVDDLSGDFSDFSSASHDPSSHASSHEFGGSDVIMAENISTAELLPGLVLTTDGLGGLSFEEAPEATIPDDLDVNSVRTVSLAIGGMVQNSGSSGVIGIENDSGAIDLITPDGVNIFSEEGLLVDKIRKNSTPLLELEGIQFNGGSATSNSGSATFADLIALVKVMSPLIIGDGSLGGSIHIQSDATGTVYITSGSGAVTIQALLGVLTDVIKERTSGAGVTVEGCLIKDDAISVSSIEELVSDQGVLVDGARVRDGVLSDNNSVFLPAPASFSPSSTGFESAGVLRTFSLSEMPEYKSRVSGVGFFTVSGYVSGTLSLRLMVGDKVIVGSRVISPAIDDVFFFDLDMFNIDDAAPFGEFMARGRIGNITQGYSDESGTEDPISDPTRPTTDCNIRLMYQWSVADPGNIITVKSSDVRVIRTV